MIVMSKKPSWNSARLFYYGQKLSCFILSTFIYDYTDIKVNDTMIPVSITYKDALMERLR